MADHVFPAVDIVQGSHELKLLEIMYEEFGLGYMVCWYIPMARWYVVLQKYVSSTSHEVELEPLCQMWKDIMYLYRQSSEILKREGWKWNTKDHMLIPPNNSTWKIEIQTDPIMKELL